MLSSDMLEKIAVAWVASNAHHRNAMLAIGRQLREYVIAGLKERDAMGVLAAKRSGIRRERLVNSAATRVETRRRNINDAIGVIAVVDLLSLDGELGSMAYKTIKFFIPLVERHKGSMAQNKDVPAEVSESWAIKECYPQAKELFRRAVAERQSKKEIQRIMLEQTKDRASPIRRKKKACIGIEEASEINKASRIFSRCSARDACQQLKDMIVNSAEPLLLATQLAAYLASRDFKLAVEQRELEERIKNRRSKAV